MDYLTLKLNININYLYILNMDTTSPMISTKKEEDDVESIGSSVDSDNLSILSDNTEFSDVEIESDDDPQADKSDIEADKSDTEVEGDDEDSKSAINIQNVSESPNVIQQTLKQSTNFTNYASDSDEDEEEFYKFDKSDIADDIAKYHTNLNQYNNDEIKKLSVYDPEKTDDNFHKTLPILTKYEKTRILGWRAKQINLGNKPFIDVPDGLIDGYEIAKLELKEKKIPFIIKRPLPNGSNEFWKVSDLEIFS